MNIVNSHRFSGAAQSQTEFNGFGNRSRSFDGVDDYVTIPDPDESTTNLTVACWVKSTQSGADKVFVSHWNTGGTQDKAWVMTLGDSGEFRVVTSSVNDGLNRKIYRTNNSINNGNWHHVAFTFSNNSLKLFVDGSEAVVSKDNDHTVPSLYNSTQPISIGGSLNSTNIQYPTDCNLADVRIYDTDLTATEISDLYSGTDVTTNLAGHWLTDADNVLDAAGTNHGTNYGSKYSYDNPSPPVEFGNASRSFDGVDDEVIISDSPSFPTGAQTWSCWVRPSRLTFGASGQDLMTRWGSQGSNELSAILFLSNAGQGKPQFYISDNGSNVFLAVSSVSLTVDTWHHIVGVFTPNTSMKIYVDGVLTGTNTTNIPSAIKDTPSDFVIGWRDFSFDAHFKGNICDCRIYDTDLTATDISDLYAGTNIHNKPFRALANYTAMT